MPFIETKDRASLFYKDWGTGEPIVFIHGGSIGSNMWEYQMPHLAGQDLRCIAYDRRGCGRSDQPGRGYDYDTLADDLAALIKQLDLRQVTLVGHSQGDGEIARYLSRHGADRIAGAVFVSATTPFLLKTADNPDGIDRSVFDDIVTELSSDRPRYFAAMAPLFFGVGLPNITVSAEIVQWAVGLALQASPHATIELLRTHSETDFRPDMHTVTVPTLIIHGDADPFAPIDVTGRKMAQAIAHSRFEIYEGASHGLFFTHKIRLNSDILAFVQG